MGLQVWLPLNGNLNNNGIAKLTFTNTNTTNLTISTTGKIGSCYQRGAIQTDGYIGSSDKITLSNDITMACWAYVSGCVGATANGLVTNHSHSNNSGVGITVKQVSTTDYRISCSTGTGDSRTFHTYYGTTNIKDAWHHLALTYSKSAQQLKLYVDGNVEYTLNSYNNYAIADYVRIFEWSTTYAGTTYRPAALLNDVRIYDNCLSLPEIKDLAKGLIVHYPLKDEYINVAPSIVYDVSGYGNNGVPIGDIVTDSSTPRNLKSTWLKSTNVGTSTSVGAAYIKGTLNNPLNSASALTISWWANMTNWNYQWSGLLSLSSNNSSPTDYQTSILNQYDDKFLFNVISGSASLKATSLVTNNAWHHYVLVYDGTNIKSYRDGVQIESKTLSGLLRSAQYIYLGLSAAGGAWRQTVGKWSDFRLFVTALSESDVQDLYNSPIRIAKSGTLITNGEIVES